MALAIIQYDYGDAHVLRAEDMALPPPGPGEVRIRHSAVGVNFHDLYVREGTARTLTLPGIPGIEAVGEVVDAGDAAGDWPVGTRVAYVTRHYGAYCSERNIDTGLLLRPPAGLSDEAVAGSLLRGLTAAVLITDLHRVKAGDRVLVHAASGNLGHMLSAWASHLGARVIGTVTSPERRSGVDGACELVVLNSAPDWANQVCGAFGGGADHVLDSIGAPTFQDSLAAAAVRGHVSLFGQAGGPVESIAVATLAARSLSVSRPMVFDWCQTGAAAQPLADAFYAQVADGVIELPEPVAVELAEAGRAQDMLREGLGRPVVLRA